MAGYFLGNFDEGNSVVDQRVIEEPKPAPSRKRYRTVALGVATLLLGGVIGAGSVLGYQAWDTGRDPAEKKIVVAGQMSLTSSKGWTGAPGGGCTGTGGYDDIHEGTNVVLKAAGGAIVGVTNLDTGHPSGSACVFTWVMTGVPGGEQFYTMEISHRGALTFERADLNRPLTTALGD